MFNDHLTKFNKRCSRSPCKVNRKDKKHGNLTLPVCFHQSVFYTLLQCTQYIFNSNLIIASALTIAKTGNFSDSHQKWTRLRLFTFSSTTRKVTEQVSTDISYNLGRIWEGLREGKYMIKIVCMNFFKKRSKKDLKSRKYPMFLKF